MVEEEPTVAKNSHVPKLCFSAAYAVTLLTEGFGLSFDTMRVYSPLRVRGTEIAWALGALLYELVGSAD